MHPICCTVLAAAILFGQIASAQTRLGLLHTAEEVAIWKQRAINGPFKSLGDVASNSPGDWDRIVKNAVSTVAGDGITSFMEDPDQDRIAGQPNNTCWDHNDPGEPGGSNSDPGSVSTSGWAIADAGFYYIVTGATNVGNAVKNELLAQAAVPGVDFWDEDRFCRTAPPYTAWNGSYIEYPIWVAKYLLAYDAVKGLMTAPQQATMDNWFRGAGYLFDTVTLTRGGRRNAWPNRDDPDADDHYNVEPTQGAGATGIALYFGGPVYRNFHAVTATNTKTSAIAVSGMIGVAVDDDFLIHSAKQYFKEMLMFSVWPQGAIVDFSRGADNNYAHPCKGLGYAMRMLGDAILVAEVTARNGDTELYDYTTSHGWYGTEGNDQLTSQPKSILSTMKVMAAYADGTFNRYMTNSAGNVGNQDFRLGPVCKGGPKKAMYSLVHNLYYKDPDIRNVYMNRKAGMSFVSHSTFPSGNSWLPAGNHGMLSGIMFRYADLEGQVWPYPDTVSPPPSVPSTPTNMQFSIVR